MNTQQQVPPGIDPTPLSLLKEITDKKVDLDNFHQVDRWLKKVENVLSKLPPATETDRSQNWSEEHINGRIKYLKDEEFKALRELDFCPIGTIIRSAKWAFIRELSYRRSELEMLLRGDNLEKPLP